MASDSERSFAGLTPLPGSRIVVVGGCGGIGRAVVDACVALDTKVAVLDLASAVAKTALPKACISIPTDVTSEASVSDAFTKLKSEWTAVDALVFVAGIAIIPPLAVTELTTAKWDEVMQVNLRSALYCAQSALPMMSGGGSIVTISSSLAFNPNKGFSAYVASKGGLISFTKALAVEHAPAIRANSVAPSAVDTEFLAGGSGRDPVEGSDKWFRDNLDNYVASIPLKRLAIPADVVGPVLFLLGPGSRYITGQVLHVNGGRITP